MNREDIIRIAREAKFATEEWGDGLHHVCVFNYQGSETEITEELERFATLVAKHTLANIDPSSFMSWQEGYEAGKQTEREACAKVCEGIAIEARTLWKARYEPHEDGRSDGAFECAEAIRARGQA